VRRRMPHFMGVATVCLAAAGLAGCSSVESVNPATIARAVHEGDAVSAANDAAPPECSKALAGAIFATSVYAGVATDQLREAGMDPQPWAGMSPKTVIFQCYGNPPTGDGRYVDSSGQETTAPPVDLGKTCTFTSTSSSCSSPISVVSP